MRIEIGDDAANGAFDDAPVVDAIDVLGPDQPIWTIGFNRRFSPGAVMLREAFADVIKGADAGGLAPPFKVEPAAVSAHGGRFSAYAHSFCGMTVQYLLFWVMESGLLLLRERRQGAWTRVRTAAVPLS